MSSEFKKSVSGVRPLKPDNRVVHTKKRVIIKPRTAEPFLVEPVGRDEVLRFVRTPYKSAFISRFKRHQVLPEDSIDLHGMTAQEAKPYLLQFFEECLAEGYRCVRVIHGKGRVTTEFPVLKNKLNEWLREHPQVIAFCSAPKQDGGVGAVYVLLAS